MRNPPRKVVVYGLVTLAGFALIWLGIARYERTPQDLLAVALIVVGINPALLGLVYVFVALFFAWGRRRLLGGKGVIARWQVPATTWARFAQRDVRIFGRGLERAGTRTHRAGEGDKGVAVIVGTSSALIGDSYHWLSPGAIPQLLEVGFNHPDAKVRWIEFRLQYRQSNMIRVPAALRIPFPPEALDAALAVFRHFDTLIAARRSG